jgi:heme/copper-type cytochrome/quinol oxidase subunit 1
MYYLIGHLMTFIPMFWLGYAGMPRRILDYPSAFGGWHSVLSAGHMLSVAGLIAFFIMIFDSLRQARAATRNTFGIGRYNTRLNFYLYENARLLHVQRKGSYLYRYVRPSAVKLNGYNYTNFEYLETTLLSYTFTSRSK